VLHGTEVKALRAGKGQIADAFARVEDNEVFLHNAHIDEYSHATSRIINRSPSASCCCISPRSGDCSASLRSRAMSSFLFRSTGKTAG